MTDLRGAAAPESFASIADWWRCGRLARYVREHRRPGDQFHMVEAFQPAGDMSDPATPDIVLCRTLTMNLRQTSDMGVGVFSDTASPGDLLAIAPNFASRIQVHVPHGFRALAISAQACRAALEGTPSDPVNHGFSQLHRGHFSSALIVQLMDLLWLDAVRGSPAGRLFADGAVQVIVAELARLSAQVPARRTGRLAPWVAQRCAAYLRAHLAADVGLDELAAVAQLSPFHFARAFAATVGLPPSAYQRRLRCERARELLSDTDDPVHEVAAAVGYHTPQAFARMFRTEVGCTPSEWRRSSRPVHRKARATPE